MDQGLEVKQLAEKLGVCAQAVINIEMNRNQPRTPFLKSIVSFLKPHLNGIIPKNEFWQLCFQNDKFYPKNQKTFGDQIRAARMQRFMSIKELAHELKVDLTTIGKWERMESNPLPLYREKLLKWINKH